MDGWCFNAHALQPWINYSANSSLSQATFISQVLFWPECNVPLWQHYSSQQAPHLNEPIAMPVWRSIRWQMVRPSGWIIDWNQNVKTKFLWDESWVEAALHSNCSPRPLTRFCLGSPTLSVTERWWTPQHTLSVPIIKAQRDCQDNAPHNNWLHKFKRLQQHIWSCCLIAVYVQLSYGETFLFKCIFPHWPPLSPEETAENTSECVALQKMHANVRRWSLSSRTALLGDGAIGDSSRSQGGRICKVFVKWKSE